MHTGVSRVGDLILERNMEDLAAYYENSDFRNETRKRLMETLLIAHSMGSATRPSDTILAGGPLHYDRIASWHAARKV